MKIAVSSCLLGEKVRFDGGHKLDHFITDDLGKFVQFVPFCPEHIAFGTPRPSMRLVKEGDDIRVKSNKTMQDLSEPLLLSSLSELSKLQSHSLCGIIFKSKSPSCGMKSAKLYLENGMVEGKTYGVFAELCQKHYPLLPMEEEGRLQDAWLRENFVMQIFAYDSIEKFKKSNPSIGDLVRFHTINKFMLQSKDEILYRKLGNIVANKDKKPFFSILELYEIGFKTAIAKKSSIKKNRNVLEHLVGFFKKELNKVEKETIQEQLCDYSNKIIPLIVPISTIYMYAKKYNITYLLDQTFLNPYPKTLALRSHIDSGK